MSENIYKHRHEIECPYCHHVNNFQLHSQHFKDTTIVYCDCEQGGCDEKFAVEHWSEPRHKIFKLEPLIIGVPR